LRAGFHRFNGVGLYRGSLYTHPVAFNLHLHMAQNYLLLVESLLGSTQPPAPRLPLTALVPGLRMRAVSAAEFAAVRARLAEEGLPGPSGGRLVLVNANASALLPQRRWPEGHFVELIQELLGQFADVHILLIGAPEDSGSTAVIAAMVGHSRCVNGAGWFPLEQLPALFSLGAAMVSNDSGPAHFAAVTALPVIVLFGPETPLLFRPLGNAKVLSAGIACSPCVNVGNQRRTTCRDNQCMQRITVAEVFAATRSVLEASSISRTSAQGERKCREEVAA
jgi:ADP-heptose:LPS heptosyltransferase